MSDDTATTSTLAPDAPDVRLLRAQDLGITARELEALRVTSQGCKPDAVARAMGVSVSTARQHLKQVRRKLDCTSTLEMVLAGYRHGLVDPPTPQYG